MQALSLDQRQRVMGLDLAPPMMHTEATGFTTGPNMRVVTGLANLVTIGATAGLAGYVRSEGLL